MNKLGLLTITIVIGMVALFATPREVNCEFCGEMFNNQHTLLEEMCDVCFGWNEHKAKSTGIGIQVDFENGEGYYFQGNY